MRRMLFRDCGSAQRSQSGNRCRYFAKMHDDQGMYRNLKGEDAISKTCSLAYTGRYSKRLRKDTRKMRKNG